MTVLADGRAVSDVLETPAQGVVSVLSVGSVVAPGRKLAVVATVAGNITIKFIDGSTITVPVAVGYTEFKYAVIEITASTATATFTNLK